MEQYIADLINNDPQLQAIFQFDPDQWLQEQFADSPGILRYLLRRRALNRAKNWLLTRCTCSRSIIVDKDLWINLVNEFEEELLQEQPHLRNVETLLDYDIPQ